MLYRPDPFRLDDPDRILQILRAHPLATLVVADASGLPGATPVPVVADRLADGTFRLRFHLARGNPLGRRLEEGTTALLSFVGAEGYVSPDWYETAELPPTWNYETVQARGGVSSVEGDALREMLADLSALEEARLAPKAPWTDAKIGEDRLSRMLRAIRGFSMTPDSVEAKAKLSQNRLPADRAGVLGALAKRGESGRALARAMSGAETDPPEPSS